MNPKTVTLLKAGTSCKQERSLESISTLFDIIFQWEWKRPTKDFKTYVDQACRAADEFVNIYYETMDKRRRALTRLYLDKATLVWNGNAVSGQEELNKFFEMLPSSEFQVNMLDCQPVHEQATQGQTTVLVVTSGTVKFDGDKQRYFNQNFLLTAQATPTNTVWKIASDCFRFQDWAS
ncbi:NTF2-related export protein 2 [Egretta garzetta]|uniref:NTF2-related export protein 2 n=1 Tax=Egretta garzetta TaxID=188379 RepID=UPI00163C46B8|nr:NTF2-related export protein 2 [Egretta garzetta]